MRQAVDPTPPHLTALQHYSSAETLQRSLCLSFQRLHTKYTTLAYAWVLFSLVVQPSRLYQNFALSTPSPRGQWSTAPLYAKVLRRHATHDLFASRQITAGHTIFKTMHCHGMDHDNVRSAVRAPQNSLNVPIWSLNYFQRIFTE